MQPAAQRHFFEAWTGWFDNSATRCREYWNNGTRGRFAHRSAICPNARHPELRAPWGTYPDIPKDEQEAAA